MIRLDRFLTEMGCASRSEADRAIRQGRVTVNGAVAKSKDMKLEDPEHAVVTFDRQRVVYSIYQYVMLNKPSGVVSANEDPRNVTVIDSAHKSADGRFFLRSDLGCVGRLDKDTEGLVLLTNDGQLTHRLLAPGKHVDKSYLVRTSRPVSEEMIRLIREGFPVPESEKGRDEFVCQPADYEPKGECFGTITISEGKYHQIKRMFLALGNEVTYLKRISIGPLSLDEALEPGQCRMLTEQELELLQEKR